MKLAILQNEIAHGDVYSRNEVAMELNNSEKMQFSNEWRTFRECNTNLIKHRGHVFSMIQGECTQLLQDKMKQDTEWNNVSTSYDPLTLYSFIERTVLAQTEDQYPFANVYDQELSFYLFRQDTLSNPKWYEGFNTKVDVGDDIGVTRHHKVLLEYVSQNTHTSVFVELGAAEQRVVRDDAEERYISYAFLRKSGNQHGNLKVDLQNDFTTSDNRYPKNRQQKVHLLDKYSNTDAAKVTQSEGTSFAQRSGRGGGRGGSSGNGKIHDNFDKEYWKDKTCYKCEKKGHPANKCPKKSKNDNDEKSVVSAARSVNNLKKDFKSMKKAFTTVNTHLEKLKEDDSDLSGSEDDDEQSHFQMDAALQFAQVDKEFEPNIVNIFKQTGYSIKIYLQEVILLDGQSTMDLFCSTALVSKTCKYTTSMRLKSNVGTIIVTRKATTTGYNKDVWFSTRAITNIITLNNLIHQYRVTHDIDDKMFVVHRESQCKPNIEFRMHTCGLHSILLSSTLFLKTRKVSRRGRSRVQSSHELCTRL
jgi:hypothetical protein